MKFKKKTKEKKKTTQKTFDGKQSFEEMRFQSTFSNPKSAFVSKYPRQKKQQGILAAVLTYIDISVYLYAHIFIQVSLFQRLALGQAGLEPTGASLEKGEYRQGFPVFFYFYSFNGVLSYTFNINTLKRNLKDGTG